MSIPRYSALSVKSVAEEISAALLYALRAMRAARRASQSDLMRFLLDQNPSIKLAEVLADASHDVVHTSQLSPLCPCVVSTSGGHFGRARSAV